MESFLHSLKFIFYLIFFPLAEQGFFLGGGVELGVWIQDFTLVKQALYTWATPSAPDLGFWTQGLAFARLEKGQPFLL
jgi:hypothetical protein